MTTQKGRIDIRAITETGAVETVEWTIEATTTDLSNEPNDDLGNATAVPTDADISDSIRPGSVDFFAFDVSADDRVNVTFDREARKGVTAVVLYAPDRQSLESRMVGAPYPTGLSFVAEESGTYYAQIADVEEGSGNYTLQLSMSETDMDDVDPGEETQRPFGGDPVGLPGRIQAQHYDYGGEGVAYHDTSPGSEYDNGFREGDDVDIRETEDTSGQYNVGFFQEGEWLEYTVDPTPGTYDIELRVATDRDDRRLRLALGGDTLRSVDVPNTGGWRQWQTVTVEDVSIDVDDTDILRVEPVNSGIDFNWIEFERVEEDRADDERSRIRPNSSITGTLRETDDVERVELPVSAGDVVNFTVEKSARAEFYAHILYPENPGTADIATTFGGPGEAVLRDNRTITENGTVEITIGRGRGTGEWTLTNRLQRGVDKWIAGYDESFRARYEPISAGETVAGTIQTPDDRERLTLSVVRGDTLNVTVKKPAGKDISADISYPAVESNLNGSELSVLRDSRTVTENGTVDITIHGDPGRWKASVSKEKEQQPFGGTPRSLPGRVQAEDFDAGGEGVAYHDTTTQNKYDTSYRDTAVDIRETKDRGGQYNIGYFQEGEWLEYTVDPTPGTYDLRLRVATERSNRQLRVSLDDETLRTVDVPNTGDWTDWETVTIENVSLDGDRVQTLRVEAVNSGIDLNWIEFRD